MSRHFDIIVVGVGTMGSAACHHLARRGVKVLGLDAGAVPNILSAHQGSSRVIRLSYFEHPSYVELLRRSYVLWDQLAEASGEPVIDLVGGLYLGHPETELITGVRRAARE